jgi:hypothetical protein
VIEMRWVKKKIQNMIREQDRKLSQIEELRQNCKLKETAKLSVLQALAASVNAHQYSLEKILENYFPKKKKRMSERR